MRAFIVTGLLLTLVGCATVNPTFMDVDPVKCDRLGVSPDQQDPLMPVVMEISTTVGGAAKLCGGDNPLLGTKYGCIFESAPGEYTIVHTGGNSKYHEWCHAKYGPRHTW